MIIILINNNKVARTRASLAIYYIPHVVLLVYTNLSYTVPKSSGASFDLFFGPLLLDLKIVTFEFDKYTE